MSTKEISAIAIKFFAITLLISTVLHAPRLIVAIATIEGMYNERFEPIFYISVTSFFLVLGFLCTFLLYKVSNSVLNSIPDSNNSPINLSERFILQILGAYFIVSALQALPTLSVYITPEFEPKKHLGYFIGYTFELAIGLYLLIAPKVWVHLFNKFRGRV